VAREERRELKVFRLTEAGAAELERWYAEPVVKVDLRDEFFTKLSLPRRSGRSDGFPWLYP
jgi:DNA-binding PadR family transcriptional regulator